MLAAALDNSRLSGKKKRSCSRAPLPPDLTIIYVRYCLSLFPSGKVKVAGKEISYRPTAAVVGSIISSSMQRNRRGTRGQFIGNPGNMAGPGLSPFYPVCTAIVNLGSCMYSNPGSGKFKGASFPRNANLLSLQKSTAIAGHLIEAICAEWDVRMHKKWGTTEGSVSDGCYWRIVTIEGRSWGSLLVSMILLESAQLRVRLTEKRLWRSGGGWLAFCGAVNYCSVRYPISCRILLKRRLDALKLLCCFGQ